MQISILLIKTLSAHTPRSHLPVLHSLRIDKADLAGSEAVEGSKGVNGNRSSDIQSSKALRELGIDSIQGRLKDKQPEDLSGGDLAEQGSKTAFKHHISRLCRKVIAAHKPPPCRHILGQLVQGLSQAHIATSRNTVVPLGLLHMCNGHEEQPST